MASTGVSEPAGKSSGTGQIFRYFGMLTLLVYLVVPHGYFLDIATSFMLKNQLHATAAQVSLFRLLTAVPVYISFVFGFARDLWNPLGRRDRGFFLLFAPATAAVFLWMAFSRLSYAGLLIGMLFVMVLFRFIAAGYQGLLALVGEEQLMTGRLSALWNVIMALPYTAGAFAGGWVAEHFPPNRTFLLVAVLALTIMVQGLWKPASVFSHAYDSVQAKGADFVGDVKRLARHRAVYPAVLIVLIFQFSPGSATPLQFYLSDQLHASDAVYGYFTGIFIAAFIPVFLLYGFLCKRVALKKLLVWGTIIAIPQMIPLVFIHSGTGALWWAVPIGAMGALLGAAMYDLAMRSCPPGLQGTLMMLVDGANILAMRGGDLIGVKIYLSSPAHGFLYCVIATCALYALILPVILLIPKELIATTDAQPNPAVEAQLRAEIAATGAMEAI